MVTECRSQSRPIEDPPALSVLMTVHNDLPEYLETAITSILSQSFDRFEFLILDDGSTRADTIQTLNRFASNELPIRLFHEPHRGLTRTLNIGLSRCRAELVCRQDADDWSTPDRFLRQVEFLSAHPELAVVGSDYILCREDGRRLWTQQLPRRPLEVLGGFVTANSFCHGAICFRAAAARQVGGYREIFACSQDYDFLWRLCERFGGANLAEPLYCHRRNKYSISSHKSIEQARARYAIKYLAKQRARRIPENPGEALAAAAATIPDDASHFLLGSADQLLLSGRYGAALHDYLLAIVRSPGSPKVYLKVLRWFLFLIAPNWRARMFGQSTN